MDMDDINDAFHGTEIKDWDLTGSTMIEETTDAENHHSMPTPEEVIVDHYAGGAPIKSRKKWGIVVACLVVFFILVIPAVVVGKHKKATENATVGTVEKQSEAGEKDAGQDTSHDTLEGRNSGMKAVVDYLVAQDISHRADLTNEATPQYKAAQWIANSDKANMAVPTSDKVDFVNGGYKYVVRYVMAVNYFALKGHNWSNKLNFMTHRDVCGWHDVATLKGVFCHADGAMVGLPSALQLCKFVLCFSSRFMCVMSTLTIMTLHR